jgi:UDPglucose 6-dehydrogenase
MIGRIGFIGFGYVGSATAHALREVAAVAFHDPAHAGSTPLGELCAWAEALFVCVPTPMGATGAADLGTVYEVAQALADVDKPVILKSTVPPGTTEELVRRWPGLPLVFSPEFLRERHHLEDAARPARVVLGWSSAIEGHHRAEVRALLERRFPDAPRIELAATEAELLKYSSNALFGVKVSFANEMAELAARLGVDWEPVRQALVLDPRVGDGHLAVPGPDGLPGFGGSCLPKDMAALLAVAEKQGVDLEVVAAAVRGNLQRRRL